MGLVQHRIDRGCARSIHAVSFTTTNPLRGMDIGSWIQLFGTTGGIISPLLLVVFRSSAQRYTDKKAENLATIQDTGRITDKVERIKSDYQMQFQASRFVYENEYSLLKEVWKECWELQAKARSLTPVVDRSPADEAERKQNLFARYQAYVAQIELFKASVIKNKPFIPPSVYSVCLEIWKLVVPLQVTFEMSFQGIREPDWIEIESSGKVLDEKLELLSDAIRQCVFTRPSWHDGKLTSPST